MRLDGNNWLNYNVMNTLPCLIWTSVTHKEVMNMKITKDMIIADIIAVDQKLIPILLDAGMHCIGCPSAQAETLEEACMVHGIEVEELVAKLNAFEDAK